MNEPFWLTGFRPSPEDTEGNIVYELHNALIFYDKNEFLRLINLPEYQELKENGYNDYACDVFENDALECAIAILNGETKGLVDIEDAMEQDEGSTPLHLAALSCAPKIIEYLLKRGDSVDVYADFPFYNLKQATPIDLILTYLNYSFKTIAPPSYSVYELLVILSWRMRKLLEIVRILVRSQNKDRVRQTFMDYANKKELVPVAGLYLAAPELFLSSYFTSSILESSSIATLYHVFSSLETRMDTQEAMLLLVDVLAMAGPKFVAYTRLEQENDLSSYYHSDQAYTDRVPPSLTHEDAVFVVCLLRIQFNSLNKAIDDKLSSMPTLYGRLEDFTAKEGLKIPPQMSPIPSGTSYKPSSQSRTYMAYGDFRNTLRNTLVKSFSDKPMKRKPTDIDSGFLISRVRLFQFSTIVKRVRELLQFSNILKRIKK